MTHEALGIEGKRPWTRRTRKDIIPQKPVDVFPVEMVDEIRSRGDELLTPLQAFSAFNLPMQQEYEQEINAILINSASPSLFEHSDDRTTFRAKDIDQFIFSAVSAGPDLLLLAGIPLSHKETILKTASQFLFDELKRKMREGYNARRRQKRIDSKINKDWGK